MLKIALLVTGLLLLALGAEGLFYAATNRQQTTVGCDGFAPSPPDAQWLRVIGCEMDYLGAGYREAGGRIVELYFPARPVGRPPTDPAPIVATTSDPSVLALAEGTIGGGRTPDQEQFLVMMLKIVTTLRASREIEGYASAGVLDRLRAKRAVAGLSTALSRDVVVIDLHAKPDYLIPGAAAAAGVLLLGMFVVLLSRRRAAAAAIATEPVAAVPPAREDLPMSNEPPHAVAEQQPAAAEPVEGAEEPVLVRRERAVRSPMRLRVMLLNLPPEAARDAIETAPPLGTRRDVIAFITQVVPSLRFDASGRASVGRSDFLLTADIGPTDPVYTVVLDAQGPAAISIVRRMLDRTNWRAFAPRSGVFIPTDRLHDYATPSADHTAA